MPLHRLVLPQPPQGHRLVFPVQRVVRQLGGQRLVGPVVLGHDQQAAGVFIDAVDDAGPQFAPDAG